MKKCQSGEKEYLLVHAGLGNFSLEKDLSEYTIHDLVWDRGVLGEKYFDDVITITGHTPTMGIPEIHILDTYSN